MRATDPLAAALGNDLLAALRRTTGKDDAPALLVRATALGQLGEHEAARALAARAAQLLEQNGRHAGALRARLVEAELAVDDLDLAHAREALAELADAMASGDPINAAWARVVAARAAQLEGDAPGAGALLLRCRTEARVPSHVAAVLALAEAEHFARGLAPDDALEAIERARAAAGALGPLVREVERFRTALSAPVARLDGAPIDLFALARIVGGAGCRCSTPRPCALGGRARARPRASMLVVSAGDARVTLADVMVADLGTRPALFALLAALARHPEGIDLDGLAREALGARTPNASHHARLRVELGRLRRLVDRAAGPIVTERGRVRWAAPLRPRILEPLVDRRFARLVSLLGDGRAWPVRELAARLGCSGRTVQRQLAELEAEGRVAALGRARRQRWTITGPMPVLPAWKEPP